MIYVHYVTEWKGKWAVEYLDWDLYIITFGEYDTKEEAERVAHENNIKYGWET